MINVREQTWLPKQHLTRTTPIDVLTWIEEERTQGTRDKEQQTIQKF